MTGVILKNHLLLIGLVVLTFAVGATCLFLYFRRKRKFKRFYEDLGLHSEERVLRQGNDKKTKALTKIHYPKFKWRKGNLHLYNYNFSKTSDYFETKREAFNSFFGKEFFKVVTIPPKT